MGKNSDGMLFATWIEGVLCASERSPQKRLTALWAVGRFLPRWASSAAWQRRLDVIKLYTLSAVWGAVKWALLLPKACTVIVYLHRSCEVSNREFCSMCNPSCIFICQCVFLQMFCPFRFYIPFCLSWRWGKKKKTSLVLMSRLTVHRKERPQRNTIAPVK